MTAADIALYLPPFGLVNRPVIDRTGLTGRFDVTILWKPDPAFGGGGRKVLKKGSGPVASAPPPGSEAEADGPDFIQALRDQLGLKLTQAKGPVESLVIDRVERPSGN
jgi:uncharacterized protein (TIGR03435 family)